MFIYFGSYKIKLLTEDTLNHIDAYNKLFNFTDGDDYLYCLGMDDDLNYLAVKVPYDTIEKRIYYDKPISIEMLNMKAEKMDKYTVSNFILNSEFVKNDTKIIIKTETEKIFDGTMSEINNPNIFNREIYMECKNYKENIVILYVDK